MSAEHPPLGAYFYPLTAKCLTRNNRARRLGYPPVNETLLVQQATPLFEGHRQPRTFSIGEGITNWDDSDPKAMAKQIELATIHGLNMFIFDTYLGFRSGHAVREMINPLNRAFLPLRETRENFQFGVMVVLGSPRVAFPVPIEDGYEEPNRHYEKSSRTAHLIVEDCIKHYWNDYGYFLINDRPYLSIYVPKASSIKRVGEVFNEIRQYSTSRYGIDPYIVGIVQKYEDAFALATEGVDALTGYCFLPNFGQAPDLQDYTALMEQRMTEWEMIARATNVPYVPPAVVGWDASPRGKEGVKIKDVSGYYPYTPIVVNGTSHSFETMLKASLDFTSTHVPPAEQYGIIFAWNEVSEGSSLLPDIVDGQPNHSYLNSVRRVTNQRIFSSRGLSALK